MIIKNWKDWLEMYGGLIFLVIAIVILMTLAYIKGYEHGGIDTINSIRTCFLVKGNQAISYCLPK